MLAEWNPPGIRETYLGALNESFGDWGSEELYDWAFGRAVGGPKADLIVLRSDSDELLAGSAVTYRMLGLSGGGALLIGIMTGSWTLPGARGQGCFTRLIQESVKVADQRGAGLLVAFVTAGNPSRRALENAGSAMFSSRYILELGTRVDSRETELFSVSPSLELCTRFAEALAADRVGTTHFQYPTTSDWISQFIERPLSTEIVESRDGWRAVLERTTDTDRLLALVFENEITAKDRKRALAILYQRAAASRRRFFAFQMEAPGGEETTDSSELDYKSGFFTALVANVAELGSALRVDSRFELQDSRSLADASSPWFLGELVISAGDRM